MSLGTFAPRVPTSRQEAAQMAQKEFDPVAEGHYFNSIYKIVVRLVQAEETWIFKQEDVTDEDPQKVYWIGELMQDMYGPDQFHPNTTLALQYDLYTQKESDVKKFHIKWAEWRESAEGRRTLQEALECINENSAKTRRKKTTHRKYKRHKER